MRFRIGDVFLLKKPAFDLFKHRLFPLYRIYKSCAGERQLKLPLDYSNRHNLRTQPTCRHTSSFSGRTILPPFRAQRVLFYPFYGSTVSFCYVTTCRAGCRRNWYRFHLPKFSSRLLDKLKVLPVPGQLGRAKSIELTGFCNHTGDIITKL